MLLPHVAGSTILQAMFLEFQILFNLYFLEDF